VTGVGIRDEVGCGDGVTEVTVTVTHDSDRNVSNLPNYDVAVHPL